MKKVIFVICVFSSLTALILSGGETPATAGAVTDTISICIGYFGWAEDQYVEKAAFNWRELDDFFGGELTTQEHVYSYYNGSRMYHAAARGVYIKDLLVHAGVDFNSVSRIDFFTMDQAVGPYRSFTKDSLFDAPRYYFPNLAAGEDSGEQYPYYGDDIWMDAVRIQPMLALECFTQWDNVGTLFEEQYDSSMFSASTRFHLFFGQLAPEEANTSSAAKYVHKILITFSGTPVLSADYTQLDMKVGTESVMGVNVSAEDGLFNEYIRANLTWSSSNDNVVKVDGHGNLTFISEGEAVITASYGQSSVSVKVRVSGEDLADEADIVDVIEETQDMLAGTDDTDSGNNVGTNVNNGTGAGTGAGTGTGAGAGAGAGTGTGTGTGTGSGTGSGTGTGTGSGTDTGSNTAAFSNTPPDRVSDTAGSADGSSHGETRAGTGMTSEVIDITGNREVFVLSDQYVSGEEFTQWLNSVFGSGNAESGAAPGGGSGSSGGSGGGRGGGMGADAVQLVLPLVSDNPVLLVITGFAFLVFFAVGFLFGIFSFKAKVTK